MCNYIKKELCPKNGNCQAENFVYETTIIYNEQNLDDHICISIAETSSRKKIQ